MPGQLTVQTASRSLVCVPDLVVAADGLAEADPLPLADCAGVWVGVGVQEGGPWTIELTLAPADGPGVCGTIEYPSLGCGGQVVDCVAEADGSITMREVYSHGLESCAPPGALRVSCGGRGTASEGHMSWVWSGEGGPVTSDLTRQ